jgi:hypothetical protein
VHSAPPTRKAWATPRRVAAAILVAGWTIAAAVWVTAPPPPPQNDDVYDMEHSKKYLLQVERIGGKAAILGTEIDAWLAGLWEGRARAYTIAALTAAVAGGYVLLERAGRAPPGGERPAG